MMRDANTRLEAGLRSQIRELAQVPVLLVACDYDGTIAPIVDDPSAARPMRETVTALRGLAGLTDTHVAVISGRGLRDLAALSRLPDEIRLVGSHGSEFDLGYTGLLEANTVELLTRLQDEVERIAEAIGDGLRVERKPTGVALHYRQATDQAASRALDAVESGPAVIDGVRVRHGKKVVELSVVGTDKGDALETLRRQVGASAVMFVGDDVTDEDAFVVLRGPDVGVKVGPGETAAGFHVADNDEVARLLAIVFDLRRNWLLGEHVVPIERHSLLSDQRTFAMLTPDARVVWMCHPRGDSSALFSQLLGGATNGYFEIKPCHGAPPISQRYLDHGMILETRWPAVTVTDYLDCSQGLPQQPADRTDLIRVITGTGVVRVEFAPRLDFGRIATRLVKVASGVEIEGSVEPYVLMSPGVEWTIIDEGRHQNAVAEIDLQGASPVVLELRCGSRDRRGHALTEPERRSETAAWWSRWAAGLTLPSIERDLVMRSAIVLRSLCYEPSGAIYAAATTSLPESMGGVRNWDYRFCWIRDAAMTAHALLDLGSIHEARRFLGWMLRLFDSVPSPERVHPLYTVVGHSPGGEATIEALSGYAGSRPVRVGNGAAFQVQTDVFGPVLELIDALSIAGVELSDEECQVVEAIVVAVQRQWEKPDSGIWEVRLAPSHHVYSKVMCWVAMDRAIRVFGRIGRAVPAEWTVVRDRIGKDVIANGWNASVGSYTAAYGRPDLDASALYIGLSGLLDPDDPRFLQTIHAVEVGLRRGPTVYRYLSEDGLPGFEGGFHLCTGWLIEAYAIAGRLDDAQALFDRLVVLVGPTGLMPEQYDPVHERSLGNHPQAYSHIAIIRAARRLEAALAVAPQPSAD
jgi:trehalose 6-phosphate phosphatase